MKDVGKNGLKQPREAILFLYFPFTLSLSSNCPNYFDENQINSARVAYLSRWCH